MVPGERLELSRCFHRRILNPVRLPIPPPRPRGEARILRERTRAGKVFFEKIYESQKRRIFHALKNSEPDSVIKFKEVLNKIINGKK